MIPAVMCPNCFTDRTPGEHCPQCGWGETSQTESPFYLRPGTLLREQYVVGRVLGHGGFGITYLGWDLNLARRIAIKEYFPGGVAARAAGDPRVFAHSRKFENEFQWGLDRYLEEARTVARFQNHPFIVWVQNFFAAHGTAYLILEYLDGSTLEHLLQSKQHFDYATALRILMPVMDALREVHGAGLLHRDISPDNIFLLRNGQIKVIDFGAARYALGQQSQNLSVILKHGYAPPEQYESRGSQGPWTDVYAVGATMYRMLTGDVPPSSPDRMSQEVLIPPSQRGVPIDLAREAALLKALSLRSDQRWPDMPALIQGLRDGIQEAGLQGDGGDNRKHEPPPAPTPAPPVPPAPAPVPRPVPPPPKPVRWLWALVGLFVALASVAGFIVYRNSMGEAAVIERFEASTTDIEAGESLRLTWAARGVDEVMLQGVGRQPPRGSVVVHPSITTIYALQAGPAEQRLQVKVRPAPANPSPPDTTADGDRRGEARPEMLVCQFDPPTVQAGQKTKLVWQSRGAESVLFEPGNRHIAPNGAAEFQPSATMTIHLTAEGARGRRGESRSATITVLPANPDNSSRRPDHAVPPVSPGPSTPTTTELRILSFESNTPRVMQGQSLILYWNISGGVRAEIQPGVGLLSRGAGQVTVTPMQNTRYVLTAWNAAGQQTQRTLDVTVIQPRDAEPPRVSTRGSFPVIHHHAGLRLPGINIGGATWPGTGQQNICQGQLSVQGSVLSFQSSSGDGFVVPLSEVALVEENDRLTINGGRTFQVKLKSGKRYNFLPRDPVPTVVSALRQALSR